VPETDHRTTTLSQWGREVATTKVFAPSRTRFLLPLAESMASVFCVPKNKLDKFRKPPASAPTPPSTEMPAPIPLVN
jgi:hypothetical protein